jgi:mono/diheme cytochrome c family protein
MRASGALAVLALLAACRGPQANQPPSTTVAAPAPGKDDDLAARAKTVASLSCGVCHGLEMLSQQRLTLAQWQGNIKKMRGWGAALTDADADALAQWLARTAGSDAGEERLGAVSAKDAATSLGTTPDGPFARGDPGQGASRWTASCADCHGPDGRGAVGPNLVDRPILWRASEFAAIVRRGGAAMPATNLSDAEVAALLAHLRSARH